MDITKDENTKFENLGYVLDGSKEHTLSRGYKIFEIDTIDNSNQPLSLISDLSSSSTESINDANKEKNDNTTWIKKIEKVANLYGKGTFILDRGFDGGIMMEKILNTGSNFIIRAKCLDRIVYLNGKKTKIKEIAKSHKGKYSFQTKIDGKITNLKVSSFNIKIKSADAKTLSNNLFTLVIIKGYGDSDAYMALITSRKVSSKDDVLQVVKDYILRWNIEDNFRFKKQQYGLEKIKVRKYKRIQILSKMLSMFMSFNNILNMSPLGKNVRDRVIQIREKINMWVLRVANGIIKTITFYSNEIVKKLYPKRTKRRRDLWTVMGVAFRRLENGIFLLELKNGGRQS